MSRKILLFGMNGLSPDLLFKFIEDGHLPNFDAIIKEGVTCETGGIIPEISSVTWQNMLSGKNPGKTGIFDSYFRVRGTYEISSEIKSKNVEDLFDILNKYGKKVIAINIPSIYHHKKINGVLISDQLPDFTYPPELSKELADTIGIYKFRFKADINALINSKIDEDTYLDSIINITEQEFKIAKYLLENKEWDIYMINTCDIDSVQHIFYLDQRSKYREEILKSYKRMDKFFGELTKNLKNDVSVIIFSDKGIVPFQKSVHINKWLIDNGLLTLESDKKTFSDINWYQTAVYHIGHGQIFINLKGREQNGIIDPGKEYEELRNSIKNALENLEDPENRENFIERVFKKEELFFGEFFEDAADMIITYKKEYRTADSDAKGIFETDSLVQVNKSKRRGDHVGPHLPFAVPGLFIIKGKNLKKGIEIKKKCILDLTPTILYMTNIPVLKDMDGKVIIDAFDQQYISSNPIKYIETESFELLKHDFLRESDRLSKEEEEKVKERLRGLGYIV